MVNSKVKDVHTITKTHFFSPKLHLKCRSSEDFLEISVDVWTALSDWDTKSEKNSAEGKQDLSKNTIPTCIECIVNEITNLSSTSLHRMQSTSDI